MQAPSLRHWNIFKFSIKFLSSIICSLKMDSDDNIIRHVMVFQSLYDTLSYSLIVPLITIEQCYWQDIIWCYFFFCLHCLLITLCQVSHKFCCISKFDILNHYKEKLVLPSNFWIENPWCLSSHFHFWLFVCFMCWLLLPLWNPRCNIPIYQPRF